MVGAFIMGKRMFEEGEVVWPEDIYKADVYVLTHEKREPWVQKGTTVFHFVNDGIENALTKARQSAQGKDNRIQGGANTIQQFLNAGHIDATPDEANFFGEIKESMVEGFTGTFDQLESLLENAYAVTCRICPFVLSLSRCEEAV